MFDSEYARQATLEAKPAKADDVEAFLESTRSMAEQEEKTSTWFALRFDETTFGIFDTFPDEEGRQAHLDGDTAAELLENADELLASKPELQAVEVVATEHTS